MQVGRHDNDTFEIRVLGAADLDCMDAMRRMFGHVFEDPAAYEGAPPEAAYTRQLLVDRHFIAIAALRGERVVGGLAAYELRKFEQARSELYLYDLAVVEAERRRGIATALISALRRIAHDRGAWMVFVQADHGDAPAIALYEKLGTREDVLHFDLTPLPPEPRR